MKYLIPIIIAILLFSCEESASTTSYQEAYILDTKVSGISWTDKDCNIDSTYIVYEKWKQGRRFIAEVNGEYFIYQTIANSNPVEHYVVDSLSLDWISYKTYDFFHFIWMLI